MINSHVNFLIYYAVAKVSMQMYTKRKLLYFISMQDFSAL